ncbi:hypothetical protein GIB67_010601 [Kingdonia uniflora]|uniref:DYW domain-containing protein n=1 Tax=Kingdonia uniflora TaxID=39325 RepID=A0A7J7MAX2_9MAGN|nr:hypothetical protein GIB67_010601 [Kingdonia uniflora]
MITKPINCLNKCIMVPSFFSNPIIMLSTFPLTPTKETSFHNFPKAGFHSSTPTVCSNEGGAQRGNLDFLHVMEQRGVQADCNTYIWLLKGCGSFGEVKRLHGRILKSGFDGESLLCDQLIDVYIGFGEFECGVGVFEDMPQKRVSSWNCMIHGLTRGQLSDRRVLHLFLRMIREGGSVPDLDTFCGVLRGCSGGSVGGFKIVEQIHSQVIRYGYSNDPIVGNPLVDLYAKNGYVNSAWLVFENLCWHDSVSFVAMISGFSRNNLEHGALNVFIQMLKSGITPTPYAFSAVLSACAKIEFYEMGEQLHAQVYKWGLTSDTFVCNALVTMYSRRGNMVFAESIFSEMGINHRNAVTYNSIISGLAQRGIYDKALQYFDKMQLSGLKPDCVTIASLVSSCAFTGDLHKGKQLQSYSIKAGFSSDIIIEGSLLDLYVKCSDLQTAHEFFDSATTKDNVVLWNVMLVAYGQECDLSGSYEIYSRMQLASMKPNQYTFPSILKTCTSVGALDLGGQIHTQIIKTGFDLNIYVCSVLIDMYAKLGSLKMARDILERLTEEDVVSWTAMIAGYAQNGLYVEALRLFEEMQIRGIQSDNIGFSSALSACAGIQALSQGRQIHAQIYAFGYLTDPSIGNALISLYARCGKIDEAYLLFATIDIKDHISWNGLISGFAQSGHYEEAMQVFTQMNHAGLGANLYSFCSALCASANIADIKQGKQIHARIIKTGYESEVEVGNALISLYAKCGSIVDAKQKYYEMHDRNEVSWNAIITGYSQHGCGREALDLFEEMKQEGVMPDHVTFVGVLSACSHVGLVNEGLNFLKSMREEYGIVPRPEHYACVVDILGRAGLLKCAKEFIEKMPIEPDALIWRTLLSACTVHKNVEIGEVAAQHLLELEPEDSATYVLLSNIYAVARKWGYRDHMRQMMKDRNVKKEPGRSWIEVDNLVHAFYVGDRLHALADKIYDFLKDLNDQLSKMGYVQDRYHLLNNIEQEQKDPTVYIHSEKLAVAFGLISLPSAIPIRVIKNLRVCSDCHNWMKFVSKVSNRSLVVRDVYRFHHFEGGICSCRDYW